MGKVHEQLLPGIPDDITLTIISSKLLWRDFYSLTAVSRNWCHAIRSRKVYNARVQYNSTETLVVVNWTPPAVDGSEVSNAIGLYSMRDNSLLYLPPIPNVSGGIPIGCESVSLDGKVYVLGGGMHGRSVEVYVLDLAGQVKWKRCADMINNRLTSGFECAVMDGKIYALAERWTYSFGDYSLGSQKYDPLENTWSLINDMGRKQTGVDGIDIGDRDHWGLGFSRFARFHYRMSDRVNLKQRSRVETAGNELLRVHEDEFEYLPYAEEVAEAAAAGDSIVDEFAAKFLEFYNPAKDDWRLVEPRWRPGSVYFTAHGKLHALSRKEPFRIHVHNTDENSWTCLHRCSFSTGIGSAEYSISVQPVRVLEVGCELLAIVHWHKVPVFRRRKRDYTQASGYCLARTKGFGSETEMILWERAQTISPSVGHALYPEAARFSGLSPIQL